jgi:hypothetical protein
LRILKYGDSFIKQQGVKIMIVTRDFGGFLSCLAIIFLIYLFFLFLRIRYPCVWRKLQKRRTVMYRSRYIRQLRRSKGFQAQLGAHIFLTPNSLHKASLIISPFWNIVRHSLWNIIFETKFL